MIKQSILTHNNINSICKKVKIDNIISNIKDTYRNIKDVHLFIEKSVPFKQYLKYFDEDDKIVLTDGLKKFNFTKDMFSKNKNITKRNFKIENPDQYYNVEKININKHILYKERNIKTILVNNNYVLQNISYTDIVLNENMEMSNDLLKHFNTIKNLYNLKDEKINYKKFLEEEN